MAELGVPKPISDDDYPPSTKKLPTDKGHVRIELTKLVKERRWNLEILRRDLSSAYRCLFESGDVRMRINGEAVFLSRPLSTGCQLM